MAFGQVPILVKSTGLQAYNYDGESQILRVRFNSKSAYEYSDVPPSLVDDVFNSSRSVGAALKSRLRGYAYHKLSTEDGTI